jgi:hypothetical protein
MQLIYKRNCPKCNKELNYKSPISFQFAEKNKQKCKDCCDRKNKVSTEIIQRILDLNAQGILNREIARTLSIHHRTVSEYLKQNKRSQNFTNQPIDLISDKEARCRKCKDIKNIDEFQYGRKGQKYEYKFSYCNMCRKKQNYLSLNNDVNKFLSDRFNRLKRRAKKDNIVCTITKAEFIKQYYSQNGLCFYTDAKLVCEVGSELHRDSLSIDKIIPNKGYIVNNVVFTTHRINSCKSDLSLEEINKWMPDWYARIKIFELSQIINHNNISLIFDWDDSRIDIAECQAYGSGYYNHIDNEIQVSCYKNYIYVNNTYRPNDKKTSEEVLYSIAHEYGHFRSLLEGFRPDSLSEDYKKQKTTVQVYEEEIRAWRFAQQELIKLKAIIHLDVFNAVKNRSLNNYAEKANNDLKNKLLNEMIGF